MQWLAVLLRCGLRRGELLALQLEWIQQREVHWVIVDLVGKGGHVRTVPIPTWVKDAIDAWTSAASITEAPCSAPHQARPRVGQRSDGEGALGRGASCGRRGGHHKAGPARSAPDMVALCHLAGNELDQIQFLLGPVSIQTTERYLGCKQKLRAQ